MRGSSRLEDRIRSCVARQVAVAFEKFAEEAMPVPENIVVFAGNGLTRIAAVLSGQEQLSWYKWCQDALDATGADVSLSYLQRIGYDLANVLGYVVDRANRDQERKIFQDLFNLLRQIEPTVVHRAIVQCCLKTCVVTTNYDNLLERTLFNDGTQAKGFATRVSGSFLSVEPLNPIGPAQRQGPTIIKIHGTLPTMNFEAWWRDHSRNGAKVIATKESYEAVLRTREDDFQNMFEPVMTQLTSPNLLVFIGMGFAGEELILSRLLLGRQLPPALTLAVAPALDPLWKFKRFGITLIVVHEGLAASSWARGLATLVLLDEIINRLDITNRERNELRSDWSEADHRPGTLSRKLILSGAGWDREEARDAAGRRIQDSSPSVIAVGNCQVNTIVGIETPMAQESAYAPKRASLMPGGHTDWLMTIEVGGQALVPTLVWNALGIPSALVSRVYDDDAGSVILNRLSDTQWLDFSGIQQKSMPQAQKESQSGKEEYQHKPLPAGDIPSTERMTAVTWFGLRTLVDWRREFDYDVDLSLVDKLRPPLIYMTKVNAGSLCRILKKIQREYQPIIVFETGGWCNDMDTARFVAESHGIAIASAKTGLAWTSIPGYASIEKLKQWLITWIEMDYIPDEPKDDRGRLYQNYRFVRRLSQEPPPALQDGLLNGLKAFIVTLGELGSIHWTKSEEGKWTSPRWCVSNTFLKAARAGSGVLPEAVEMGELRNGLQCGDVARAGFVASLLKSIGFSHGRRPSSGDIEYAVAWLNWFGMQKVRFFALEDLLSFLSKPPVKGCLADLLANPNLDLNGDMLRLTCMPDGFQSNFRLINACDGKGLHSTLNTWLKLAERWLPKPEELKLSRSDWQTQIKKWQTARELT